MTVSDTTALLACSEFLTNWTAQHSEQWHALQAGGVLTATGADLIGAPPAASEDDFAAALRRFRNHAQVIIGWRDLAGADTLETTLALLSDTAQQCIEAALCHAEQAVSARHGRLLDTDGKPMRLIVIALGKLGGRELNFSSDVDLVFSHAGPGASTGARPLDAGDWCTRVARRLVRLLGELTRDGFVYRVDTRLRPFGEAGALVNGSGAMENYYQMHGRDWERYAWIKARPVAGDIAGGRHLITSLRPFVYRRYLDYGAFESLRDMKALIDRQVARAEWQDNIKLGRGGIREIEFVAQAFQLVRGGQEPRLQDTRLLPTLSRLARGGHVSADAAAELAQAYRFLRRLENRLQLWADQQTHDLPTQAQPRRALAAAMAMPDWAALRAELDAVRSRVHDVFEQVFAAPQAAAAAHAADRQQLLALWEGELTAAESTRLLAQYGLADAAAICTALTDLQRQNRYRQLHSRGRRWLTQLVPLLFTTAADMETPDLALLRTLSVLAAVIGRSTYMALLVEYPDGLARLMRLCEASPWVTGQIARQPSLLDALLDPSQLYRPAGHRELEATLSAELAALPARDLEREMDLLRRFTQRAMLRIAAADISRALPLMVVSDHLTELAEVVLDTALHMARQQMTARYGRAYRQDGQQAGFCVIGYGKLGGLELGYGSDLDLVFVYDGPRDALTDGGQQLPNHVYFTRLAQRLIHILSLRTPAGRAYDIDLRLRPSGDSGLLAMPIDAFASYQRDHAWTWEHQALVRARPIAGSIGLGARFKHIRQGILAQPRDLSLLAAAVQSMRERMRTRLDGSTAHELDVRQMHGGLIDIEFMAQFAALYHGHACAELLLFSDTIRILETLESAGIASYADIRMLTSAYRAYRRHIHARALQERPARIAEDDFVARRSAVQVLWQQWLGAPSV